MILSGSPTENNERSENSKSAENQGSLVAPLPVPPPAQAVTLVKDYFLNRTDRLAFLAPWGKACPVEGGEDLDKLLLAHVLGPAGEPVTVCWHTQAGRTGRETGHFRLGTYSPAPDGSTRFACLDCDGGGHHGKPLADPLAVALGILAGLQSLGIAAHLEQSGSGLGWHVWTFFDCPVPAAKVRALLRAILPRNAPLAAGGTADPLKGAGIEIFPKQDKISDEGLGNLIWLPWWHGAAPGANVFYVPRGNAPKAWEDGPARTPAGALDRLLKRRYVLAALRAEVARLRETSVNRNDQLNRSAFALGQLIQPDGLERQEVENALTEAACQIGLDTDPNCGLRGIAATIRSGIEAGLKEPRDLSGGKTYGSQRGEEGRPGGNGQTRDGDPNADPPPTSPPQGNVNEALDDPHRLARGLRETYCAGADEGLVFWRSDFLAWHGSAYREVPDKEARTRLTAHVKEQFDKKNCQDLARWERKPAADRGPPPVALKVSTRVVSNALQALESLSLVPATVPQPSWLHGEGPFPATETIAFPNTLVHLPSLIDGKPALIPPTPRLFSVNTMDYEFQAEPPRPAQWLEFLQEVWPQDPETVACLQEWFGYCLLPDTSQQKILLIVGPRRSGKGTIGRLLGRLVGLDNVCAPTLAGLATNFGLAPLLGKTVAIVSDARLSGRADSVAVTERLLSISGEDTLDIDRKHRAHVSTRLLVRFCILTNELPRLSDASGALAGRLIVLRQTKSWYGKEDPRLTARLTTELPGILAWAIGGWQRLRDRGRFEPPASGQLLTQEMEDLSSPVGAFVRECCIVGDGFTVSRDELFNRWKSWCEARNRKKAGTREGFGRDLRAVIPGLGESQPRTAGGRSRCYTGVRLKTREETQADPEGPDADEAVFA